MKRTIIIIYLVLISICGISAAARLSLGPMQGSFGVNLASEYYKADSGYTGPDSLPPDWRGDQHGVNSVDDLSPGQYSNDTIVAGGSIDSSIRGGSGTNETNLTGTVSVTCPTGFNFVSLSNSGFQRPFGLLFIVSWGSNHGDELSSRKKVYRIDGNSNNEFTLESHEYPAVWFDVILLLPGELTDDKKGVLVDNKIYPLVDGEYVANVTITLKSDNASPRQAAISIPFSGFFDSDALEIAKLEDAMNISVQTTAAASNLDIKNLSATGNTVKVADIEMYYYKDSEPTSGSPKMFLSASNDPFSPDTDGGFALLHTSVGYDTPHTSYNSIGYSVSTQSYSATEAGDLLDANFVDSPPSEPVMYYGEEWTDAGATVLHSKGSSGFIYPRLYTTQTFLSDPSFKRYYYYWKSGIYVKLDPMASDVMYEGIYRDTIYFHVIYDDGVV